ncbi:MAG TPA: hypothetical protein VHG93_22500 [Longimicrobium sp.]|nr:hypothetical protein [Longimicrobium sp.]
MTSATAPAGDAQDAAAEITPARAEAELARVEAEHDLLQYQVDGWCVWPLLRLAVGKQLQRRSSAAQDPMTRGQRLRLAAGDLAGAARLRRSDVLIKSLVSGLADHDGGAYRDVWFHELLEAFPGAVKIDGVNSPSFLARRARARHPGAMTTELFGMAAGVLGRFRPPAGVERAAAGLAEALAAGFGPGLVPLPLVRATLLRFYWTRRAYGLLLARVRPRWVFTADPGENALAAAARERGIRVLEMQHGLVYGDHHAYGWTGYAVPYRGRMPVPDRVLVYGEHWRRALARGGFWGDALRVVGSLRMDAYRARRGPPGRGGERMVLVTSQDIETERLAAFLAEFLRLEPDPGLRLVVKLHPASEPRGDAYRAALGSDPRASVVAGAGESTFDLLLRAHLHLSISSTCHYEALGLGVATAVLPFATHQIVAPLWEAGHATLLSTPGDLRALLAGPLPRVGEEVSGYYFQPGALGNLMALLADEGARD